MLIIYILPGLILLLLLSMLAIADWFSSEQLLRAKKADQVHAPRPRVRWNAFVYQGDPERTLGLTYEDVRIPGQVGPLPAWFVAGPRTTWVLIVHGYNGLQCDT